MTRGIADIAVYAPRTRLRRAAIADAHAWAVPALKAQARGTIAAANWDEDSVTLAHAAARQIVGVRPAALSFCSTSMPFADRSHAALLAEALHIAGDLHTLDVGASARAATSALRSALQQEHDTLVVAAERRLAKPGSPQEISYGDAAVALRTGSEALVAEYLGGASRATDFVDHYRASDAAFDYAFEDRWVRDEGQLAELPALIPTVLAQAGLAPADVRWLAFNAPSRVRAQLARRAGLANAVHEFGYEHSIGKSGAAEPVLGLAEALARAEAGDVVLCAAFGQGLDVMVFRATGKAPTGDVMAAIEGGEEDDNYLRFASHRGLIEMDWGKRAERDVRTAQSAYYRAREQVAAFVGGRCPQCGTIQFPRTQVCVNPECRAFGEQEPYPFADLEGTVKSFTEDWQAYSPAPPLIYGNIGFEGGANILMQFSDAGAGSVRVGDTVRMAFRIKDIDRVRGFRRYFWKAVQGGRC